MTQVTGSHRRPKPALVEASPDVLASRILAAIGRCGVDRGRAWSQSHGEVVRLRRVAADAFGRQSGLVATDRPFSITALRHGRRLGPYSGLMADWPSQFADHAGFYRTADRRAAAVVAHLYDLDDDTRRQCDAWAARHGLRADFPTAFPSWWYPTWTQIVLYTSRAHAAGNSPLAGAAACR